VLSSLRCRHVVPISGRSVGRDDANEIQLTDLSRAMKRDLRALAHEIAGAVVLDLGLDASSDVFAAGKTASLVGHSLLGVLEGLVTKRRQCSEGHARTLARGLQVGHIVHRCFYALASCNTCI
jgi:hypothetical protein